MNLGKTATLLTTDQFETSILELEPRVAVFDCDGTLWSGDAGSSFMHWTIEQGLVPADAVRWLNGRYAGYRTGDVSELAICGEMVQVYQGLRESDLREAARVFFSDKIEANLFPEMAKVISDLQAMEVEIWAVSSTNDWVIEEGVKRFGLHPERVLAARVEVRNGIVTNRVLDVPTDEGKVASLARVGVTRPDCVFGNSVHDAAMLAIARRAFPVNPSAALMERSAAEGWPIYFPASVRPSKDFSADIGV